MGETVRRIHRILSQREIRLTERMSRTRSGKPAGNLFVGVIRTNAGMVNLNPCSWPAPA